MNADGSDARPLCEYSYDDWCPDWQPIVSEPAAVGGEITPITTLALLPWIALIGAALAVAALGYTVTRRKTIIH